jgi:hypothetical protein
MTGRELIMYILSNNLEDEPIFKDGVFVGYKSVWDAAVEMDVGYSTMMAMILTDRIEYVNINGQYFVPCNFNKKGE